MQNAVDAEDETRTINIHKLSVLAYALNEPTILKQRDQIKPDKTYYVYYINGVLANTRKFINEITAKSVPVNYLADNLSNIYMKGTYKGIQSAFDPNDPDMLARFVAFENLHLGGVTSGEQIDVPMWTMRTSRGGYVKTVTDVSMNLNDSTGVFCSDGHPFFVNCMYRSYTEFLEEATKTAPHHPGLIYIDDLDGYNVDSMVFVEADTVDEILASIHEHVARRNTPAERVKDLLAKQSVLGKHKRSGGKNTRKVRGKGRYRKSVTTKRRLNSRKN